jgi:hypothetical protein
MTASGQRARRHRPRARVRAVVPSPMTGAASTTVAALT